MPKKPEIDGYWIEGNGRRCLVTSYPLEWCDTLENSIASHALATAIADEKAGKRKARH